MFADEQKVRHVVGCCRNPTRPSMATASGRVEGGALLLDVRRRKIGGNFLIGQREPTCCEKAAITRLRIPELLDRGSLQLPRIGEHTA